MTSQLNVDTIVDKAGSGGTNVKIGNTSTYVSDGGSATQNTVQGLCKSWVDLDGGGTIDDSLNVSGSTDNGTGNYTFNFSSNMGNVNYCSSGSAGTNSNVMHCTTSKATTACQTQHRDYSNTLTDLIHAMTSIHGDLA